MNPKGQLSFLSAICVMVGLGLYVVNIWWSQLFATGPSGYCLLGMFPGNRASDNPLPWWVLWEAEW